MKVEAIMACSINASGYCDEQILCGCDGCRYYELSIIEQEDEA